MVLRFFVKFCFYILEMGKLRVHVQANPFDGNALPRVNIPKLIRSGVLLKFGYLSSLGEGEFHHWAEEIFLEWFTNIVSKGGVVSGVGLRFEGALRATYWEEGFSHTLCFDCRTI